MSEPLTDQSGMLAEEPPLIRYGYKASLIGAAHQFELTRQGLSWHVAGRSGLWPYAGIAAIRLSYRPISMQSQRFRADIETADGRLLTVFSTTWLTAALMAPQDCDYRAFILGLHERMKAAGSQAVLIGGLKPRLYTLALALLALVALALSGLLLRALFSGAWAGAMFLTGFAALFGWQIGGFMRRNRPRGYTLDEVPAALLP